MPRSGSTEPRGHQHRCKDSNKQGKSWCSWGRPLVLCCCLHVLVKLKSRSLHECCVISTFIPHCTWERPIPEVLSGCTLASCAVGCVWVHTKTAWEQSARGWFFILFFQTLQQEAGDGLGWSWRRCYEHPEPGECLCPKSVRCGEPLCVSRLDRAPQKTSFLEYFLISWIPREG